ncbi:hypothetical protein ACH5RR_025409 [Cinchona calisaya]|uniref:Uncharacterized protein n=1 Tax=Cinchona calisaya TaxID=153742 RepID=A0ABD2Z2R0_9GENT
MPNHKLWLKSKLFKKSIQAHETHLKIMCPNKFFAFSDITSDLKEFAKATYVRGYTASYDWFVKNPRLYPSTPYGDKCNTKKLNELEVQFRTALPLPELPGGENTSQQVEILQEACYLLSVIVLAIKRSSSENPVPQISATHVKSSKGFHVIRDELKNIFMFLFKHCGSSILILVLNYDQEVLIITLSFLALSDE